MFKLSHPNLLSSTVVGKDTYDHIWKQDFLTVHLPWKINQLRAYARYDLNLDRHRHKVGAALDISTMVAARLLLEFLGVKYSSGKLHDHRMDQARPRSERPRHDVTVEAFSLEPVKREEVEKIPGVKLFLHRADKIVHCTWDGREKDGWEVREQVALAIEALMREHFYAPLGEQVIDLNDLCANDRCQCDQHKRTKPRFVLGER
jgi:hypothetical protein